MILHSLVTGRLIPYSRRWRIDPGAKTVLEPRPHLLNSVLRADSSRCVRGSQQKDASCSVVWDDRSRFSRAVSTDNFDQLSRLAQRGSKLLACRLNGQPFSFRLPRAKTGDRKCRPRPNFVVWFRIDRQSTGRQTYDADGANEQTLAGGTKGIQDRCKERPCSRTEKSEVLWRNEGSNMKNCGARGRGINECCFRWGMGLIRRWYGSAYPVRLEDEDDSNGDNNDKIQHSESRRMAAGRQRNMGRQLLHTILSFPA